MLIDPKDSYSRIFCCDLVMSEGNKNSPGIVVSCQVTLRQSSWHVHQFKIVCGEVTCQVAVLRMHGSLLMWLGSKEPELGEIALGTPVDADKNGGHTSLATTLIGAEGSATAMARRLGTLLQRPVYVCTAHDFDRLTIPIIERGLVAEIKSRPECFYSK